MRLVTLDGPDGQVAAVVTGAGLAPLADLGHASVLDLIEAGPVAWAAVTAALDGGVEPDPGLDALVSVAPIPRPPRNVFCIGLNYRAHAEEGGGDRLESTKASPIVFTKPWTALVGDDAAVLIDPLVTTKVDWEAELAIVIGIGGLGIAEEDAMAHVFGATLANDLSARDVQLANGDRSQWFVGKSLDGFCPLGPELVTLDELPPLDSLRLQLRVDGEVMQDLHTVDMIHSIPAVIAYLSRGMRLLPGDVILTGTGAGVGHWQTPPRYLTSEDVVEVSATSLGTLRTRFVHPAVRTP